MTVATEIIRDDLFLWMPLCFRKYCAFPCCFVMVQGSTESLGVCSLCCRLHTLTITPVNSLYNPSRTFRISTTSRLVTLTNSTDMASYRGIPLSSIQEHYVSMRKINVINYITGHPQMREAFRTEMLSAMFEDVIEVNTGHSFQSKQKQPEQQGQRIWEIDSDEEEKEEKKRAENKKKYLRKKEKAQAEKAELQQKLEEEDTVSLSFAGMSIQDAPTVSTEKHQSSSDNANTARTKPKLSKRQKKTVLKKTKLAQTATSTPELVHSSSAGESASESSHIKPKASKDDESDKENKASGIGHEKQDDKSGDGDDGVATESEVEAVMETIAKRFGQ
jgi:hypothetical protein